MAEGIDVELLGRRLHRARQQRKKTLEQVFKETGISVATLSRIERGQSTEVGSTTLLAVTDWIGTQVEKLKEKPSVRRDGPTEDTPDIVELYLRADPKLDKSTAAALARMFRAAYDALSQETDKEK